MRALEHAQTFRLTSSSLSCHPALLLYHFAEASGFPSSGSQTLPWPICGGWFTIDLGCVVERRQHAAVEFLGSDDAALVCYFRPVDLAYQQSVCA